MKILIHSPSLLPVTQLLTHSLTSSSSSNTTATSEGLYDVDICKRLMKELIHTLIEDGFVREGEEVLWMTAQYDDPIIM